MTPTDINMYNIIKKDIFLINTTNSAYRSGLIVRKYKEMFLKKYGITKNPYIGNIDKKNGLYAWFKQKWVNQRGEIGYKEKGDIYRPTYKYGNTPILMKTITQTQLTKAKEIKQSGKNIKNFKKLQKRKSMYKYFSNNYL